MQIIGILGGVASGKSVVARHFAKLGAGVLDADQAGREALELAAVKAAARCRWGDEIFDTEGRIDRGRLAAVVFASTDEAKQERRYLESLVHPEIGRLLKQQADTMRAAGLRAAVLDAPLLIEAGWGDWCDKMVFVDVPRGLRVARAAERGWSDEEYAAREAAQELLERKREYADVTIDNSGSPERTQAQVEQMWTSLFR